MIPLVVALNVLLLLASPLLVLAGVVIGFAVRSSRPVRTALLLVAYAALELTTLVRILRAPADWNLLLRQVMTRSYAVLRVVLDVRVLLADGSPTAEQLRATGNPVVVLARHCGPGDSLFVVWLLAVHYGLRPRIVLKSLLRVEPVIDLAGDHLPLCFVGGRRTRRRIGATAATMTAGDALLLFPEGRNFSWPRWRRSIIMLRAKGALSAARRALRRTHTLPPRVGGTFAALSGAPTADVLMLAHTGFAEDGRNRPWWRLPVHRPFGVRTALIPAADVPRTEAELSAWLETAWSIVDAWVDATADGT